MALWCYFVTKIVVWSNSKFLSNTTDHTNPSCCIVVEDVAVGAAAEDFYCHLGVWMCWAAEILMLLANCVEVFLCVVHSAGMFSTDPNVK